MVLQTVESREAGPLISRWWQGVLPLLFMLLAAAVSAAPAAANAAERPFSQGLLFRLESPGQPVSYLFGTIHSDDPRVTRLPTAVRRAFDGAGTLIMEVPLTETNTQRSMAAVLFRNGQQLSEVLEADLYRQVIDAMGALGMAEPVVRRCKPWGLVTLLSAPPVGSGKFLDQLLYEQAMERELPVEGLENVDEQLEIFERLSQADQVALLQTTLANRDRMPEMHEQLLQTYLRKDLVRLQELGNLFMRDADPALVERFYRGAITERNARMVTRLLPMLRRQPAFVAIGALHLPGPDGVLFQLHRQGFEVTRVY